MPTMKAAPAAAAAFTPDGPSSITIVSSGAAPILSMALIYNQNKKGKNEDE